MKRGILIRLKSTPIVTLGQLIIFDGLIQVFSGVTLELPWKNNQVKVSCIPSGKYLVSPRVSEKFGNHYILQNVPQRDLILIHSGNKISDTEGCILVGRDFSFSRASDLTIINSRAALVSILKSCPDGFSLEIIDG